MFKVPLAAIRDCAATPSASSACKIGPATATAAARAADQRQEQCRSINITRNVLRSNKDVTPALEPALSARTCRRQHLGVPAYWIG